MDMGGTQSQEPKPVISLPPTPVVECRPIYVPFESLTQPVIRSMISVVYQLGRETWNFSQRTVVSYLLAVHEKLEQARSDEHAIEVRSWLVDDHNAPLDWEKLQCLYAEQKKKHFDRMADYFGADSWEPYYELTMATRFAEVTRSREYIAQFRGQGFKPEELKLYWSAQQVEDLCPKDDASPSHDPSDADAIENLRQYPVEQRMHPGVITYVHDGIEKAVFQVPEGAQIIVLNFANEQSPGGGYLRCAKAQEEVLLYNSDAYRSLLDLQYTRMNNGYAIPEFGLGYVRNIRVFDQASKRPRVADMMVSACYCLNMEQLYPNPRSKAEWKANTLAKFRAFMAAAVANTVGDGSNTYLLLGPIGTGAFGNDVKEIAEVFRDALRLKMMNSTKAVRYCFGHIWFVSTEKFKNDIFEQIITDEDHPQ